MSPSLEYLNTILSPGTICLADICLLVRSVSITRKSLTASLLCQVNIMINMAEMVVRRVEKSYVAAHRAEHQQLARALDAYSRPILFVDTGVDPWSILFCNSAAAAVRCFSTSAFTPACSRVWIAGSRPCHFKVSDCATHPCKTLPLICSTHVGGQYRLPKDLCMA